MNHPNDQYFAILRGKKVVACVQAYPPQELKENQIGLTEEEFFLLRKLSKYDLQRVRKLLRDVQMKINKLTRSQDE